MNSLYSEKELIALGLRFGSNVSIHRSVEFFKPDRIQLGSNVRIDCFCVLSAGHNEVILGDYVHCAVGCGIFGSAGVVIGNYSGLSSGVKVFSTSDDYSAGYLTNPTVPKEFRKVTESKVVFEEHVIIGSGSIIMPGVVLERGVAVGALSFVNKRVPKYSIVAGNPLRKLGLRDSVRLDNLEAEHKKMSQE